MHVIPVIQNSVLTLKIIIYNNAMNKTKKITVITIGILLLLNGLLNIIDDGTILNLRHCFDFVWNRIYYC